MNHQINSNQTGNKSGKNGRLVQIARVIGATAGTVKRKLSRTPVEVCPCGDKDCTGHCGQYGIGSF